MKGIERNARLILAIAPSSRGIGFALIEDGERLVNWGVRGNTSKKDKNAEAVGRATEMILHYRPDILVLEKPSGEAIHRSPRIKFLCGRLATVAGRHGLKVVILPRQRVRTAILGDGKGTKQLCAEAVAKRFPDELGYLLPPPRRAWISEDYRMAIFDAVALGITAADEKGSRPSPKREQVSGDAQR